MKKKQGPMPTVEYNGRSYALLSRSTVVPNLQEMDSLHAAMWILRNTRSSGYSKPNPLAGMGGAIKVTA
jgi:hypothetical protein